MEIIILKCIYLYLLTRHMQSVVSFYTERQKELISIINSNPNSTWLAGYNNHISNKLELNTTPIPFQNNRRMKIPPRYFNLLAANDLPTSFDARRKWSPRHDEKCPTIRKVLNNGKCKCGWATSLANVVSDRLCISSNFRIKQPLSAQQLISCCKNCCSCNGGNIQLGWEYVKKKGLVTGGPYNSNIGCQPYLMRPCHKTYECSTQTLKVPQCWEQTCKSNEINLNKTGSNDYGTYVKTFISDYYSISRKHHTKIMKDLFEQGPLQVSMHMYEDFRVYTKGIYSHITGDFICDHGVKLIGWGIENGYKYWLLMNSFGPLWGESGLFKISMDGTDNTDFGYAIIGPIF